MSTEITNDQSLGMGTAQTPAQAPPVTDDAKGSTLAHDLLAEETVLANAAIADCASAVAKADQKDPTPAAPELPELVEWLQNGHCPPDALDEANTRLDSLLGGDAKWQWDIAGQWHSLFADFEDKNGRRRPVALLLVLGKWEDAVTARSRPKHPLAPLLRAWWSTRPYMVTPTTRTTGRIIPARIAQANPASDSRAGRLFSFAAHSPDGQMILPGFATETIGPALPLVLYDLGSGPSSRSRAAPLAMRMFVESLLAVPQQDRGTGRPVAYEVSLRQFLAWFWPDRDPTPSEYWEALMAASDALDQCRVPLIDPDTQMGQLRRIVSIGGIPRGARALDDAVRIVVDLPRDSQNGPQLPDSIRSWGNRSAPAYRALINLAFHWYNPGRSHFPVGKRRRDGRKFWAQSSDPERYPILSEQQMIELCYPTSANRSNRRVLTKRAHQTIEMLNDAGELRIVDGQILPPDLKPKPESGST